MAGKHRADASESFSVHGRANRGAADGEQNPGRDAEAAQQPYSQAESERRAEQYAQRHPGA